MFGEQLDQMRQDCRAAARSLTRYPVGSAVAVLSLAAGIGSASATLAIRDTIFRNPPPLYQQPEQLSLVVTRTQGGGRRNVPAGVYTRWIHASAGRQQWAAAQTPHRQDVRAEDRTRTLPIQAVTPRLFSILGVQAALGRIFDEGESGDASAVVLSHRAWQLLFDSRREAVGQTVWINERPYVVSGVMPERFWFLAIEPFVWTMLDAASLPADSPLRVVVRRPAGLSDAALRGTLDEGVVQYIQTLPQGERALRAGVETIGGTAIGRQVSAFLPYLLGGCVVLTWLICCANVAVLLIAHWTTRQHELGIRASLGASRARTVRMLLTEAVFVAVIGGLVGLGATFALRGVIRYNAGPGLAMFDTSIHASVILQSAVLTFVTGLLAGLAPALYETRQLSASPLGAKTSERVRQRWRDALVIAEITATVALLVVAGAMVDGYRRNMSTDLGYPTRALLVGRVENAAGVPSEQILQALDGMPEVVSAAAATAAPFAGVPSQRPVALDAGGASTVRAGLSRVSPGFFATLGVRMRAGRAFMNDEASTEAAVAIVNESLATRLFPGQNPIGARLWVEREGYEVVGMVADYLPFALAAAAPAVYLPLGPDGSGATRLSFVLRAPTAAAALMATLRRDIPRIGGGNVVAAVNSVDEIIAIGGQEILAGTSPLVPLITIGITLTTVGIYALLAFVVARRSRELAVRVAMGATRRDIVRLVTRHTFRLIGIGTLLGIAATFGLSRVVRAAGGAGSMFDTPSWPAFALPALILAGVGVVAMWIPSRRALRIEPAVLLRVD
jgi:putative ABC transport system permease protein